MDRAGLIAANLKLELDLHDVLDALGAASIEAAVLKGLPLTRSVYGRLDSRQMVDNDILVHRADAPAAVEALRTLGYSPWLSLDMRDAMDAGKELKLVRGGSAPVDLHWAIFEPLLQPIPEKVVWSHTRLIELGGRTVRVLDRPLTLIHLAAHYAHHGFREKRILRDLVTAWEQWREQIDEATLVGFAHALGLQTHLAYAFGIADRMGMLTVGAPRGLRSWRANILSAVVSAPRDKARHDRVRRDYIGLMLAASLARPDRAIHWLVRDAFPPLPLMAALYRQPISWRLRLRYLSRPLRPILRRFGRL